MRKHWLRYFVVFGLAGLLGGVLLHTSQSVQQAEDDLRRLSLNVENEEEAIRVLEAEWNYLNRPDRLEGLAAQYLDLVPPRNAQFKGLPAALPDASPPTSVTAPPLPISMMNVKPGSKPAVPAKARKSFDSLLNRLGDGGLP